MSIAKIRQLDARCLECPLPLLRLRQALHAMSPGQQLRVLATDPAAERDFNQVVKRGECLLLQSEYAGGEYRFLIQKVDTAQGAG